MEAIERFVENAARLREIVGEEPEWLVTLRSEGLQSFRAQGFPGAKHEEWKYTSLKELSQQSFSLAGHEGVEGARSVVDEERLDGAHLLVFVDGELAANLSDTSSMPAGVRLGSLRAAVAEDEAWVRAHLGRQATLDHWPMTALNSALWRDGLALRVPAKVALERPVQVIYLMSGRGPAAEAQLRALVEIEAGASATLIETHVGLCEGQASFTNAVSEVAVGDNAQLRRVKVGRERDTSYHVARFELSQGRDSVFRSHVFSLGGKLSRDDLDTRFCGEGGECELYGLFFAEGDHVVDHHTAVDHGVPRCRSVESYKGILDGSARGVFNGKVFVREGAQQTDGQQSNKNLLLSEQATINTKPQLEIFADDVKCTHGATVGQLDEDALFYLRARGIGLEQARSILIRAFAAEVIEGLEHEGLRAQLEQVLAATLARE